MEFTFLLLLALYLLHTLVACARSKENKTAVAVLNILLGWTFVGGSPSSSGPASKTDHNPRGALVAAGSVSLLLQCPDPHRQ